MQATIDASALKPFTRALTCLSRYGDELTIYATPDHISLSTTNSSKSAYCRFRYEKDFFSRYHIGQPRQRNVFDDDEVKVISNVTGQLLTKNLLSILKHRTVEKAVERCELSVVEGTQEEQGGGSDDETDGLESKLILKLICKHGVIKTHRLLLSIPTSLMAPGVPEANHEARVMIGPSSLRHMLEHFPIQKGAKADPQLIWSFGESEVSLKTSESSMDKGKGQISTELTISAEEFEVYDIYASPLVIAFHLREFNATIAFADAMSLPLEMRFTDPAAPLFIDIEHDSGQGLFVISTSQVAGAPVPASQSNYQPLSNRKRDREETPLDVQRPKRTVKIVHRVEASSVAGSRQTSRIPESMPPPSLPRPSLAAAGTLSGARSVTPRIQEKQQQEPLFLPSSQLSVSENNFLKEAGLGDIGTVEELNALLEDEGEEVDFSASQVQRMESSTDQNAMQIDQVSDTFEVIDELDFGFGPTQPEQRGFQPLFTD